MQTKLSTRALPHPTTTLWARPLAVLVPTGFAFVLYWWTLAPTITWTHHGADGGELLAAAVTNGVPHPPGYPLYMLLLQGWLWLTGGLYGENLAWRGNLLSALYAALSVSVTVVVAGHQIPHPTGRWLWAGLAGLAWAASPLLWSQAIITEVYAFHALLVAGLGWAILVQRGRLRFLAPLIGLGIAHHLTFILLLPAAFVATWLARREDEFSWSRALAVTMRPFALGGILGVLFYLRTPLVAAWTDPVSPINWGYPDNWRGFWWLISGAAYQGYLFNTPLNIIWQRISALAYTLTWQFTPVGLALALTGLAFWDQHAPRLRTVALLWSLPVSIYSIIYYTRDSEIYLLPVLWLVVLLLAVGLSIFVDWIGQRRTSAAAATISDTAWRTFTYLLALFGILGVIVLAIVRFDTISLRQDQAAHAFLAGAVAVVEPNSIVVSSADAETFALWYGAWGSGDLLEVAPGSMIVNYSLLQFDWYRRLMAEVYPDIPAAGQSFEDLMAANVGRRPVFFSEKLTVVPDETLTPVGPLWRYRP